MTNPTLGAHNSLFMADTILPAQWGGTAQAQYVAQNPCTRLLAALFEDALLCYQRYALKGSGSNRQAHRLHQEAADWLFADDPLWVCSSTNVMLVLGLDPERTRAGLRTWLEQHREHCPPVVEIVLPLEPSPLGGKPPTKRARYCAHRRQRQDARQRYDVYVEDRCVHITYRVATAVAKPVATLMAENVRQRPTRWGPRYIERGRNTTAPVGDNRGGHVVKEEVNANTDLHSRTIYPPQEED